MRFVQWVEAWDISIFRWINRGWAHPGLDAVMRFLSGNAFFVPALVVLAVGLVSFGGRRGRVFVVMLSLCAAFANGLVADPIKRGIGRSRPYVVVPEARLMVGRGNPRGSLPSAHAMNVALMTMVAGWYYRRSIRVCAPIAVGVAVSRVYNGAHFPSDVLVGAVLGVGSGLAVMLAAQGLWRASTQRWQPTWFNRMPSLLDPDWRSETGDVPQADGGKSA